MQHHVVTLKLTDVSEVHTASIITLMMEAVSTSETSVNFSVTTWRYFPEDSKLHCGIQFEDFPPRIVFCYRGSMTHWICS